MKRQSAGSDSELPCETLSSESVRTALRACDSAKELARHPLGDLATVKTRQQAAGYSNTAAGRGLALRETLYAAIETLRPQAGSSERGEKRWRSYLILTEHFIRGRTPDCIATDLNISRRTYYGEQEQAIAKVVEVLCRWEAQTQTDSVEVAKLSPLDSTASTQLANTILFMVPPRPPHTLIGRENLFNEAKSWLLNGHAVALGAFHGLPGVGKTALAIELAHDSDIQARFSDGVLWVGLGRHPEILPSLVSWALAMNVPMERLARCTTVIEYARLIHTAIGLRPLLLVIDDAWQLDDALAFKVGGPNCAYLVTTRLASIAMDFAGERTTTLHELSSAEGLSLLSQLAPAVVETDPEEVLALVQRVGGLPLALILMGGYLRRQSHAGQPRRLQQALLTLQEAETRLKLTQPQSLLEQPQGSTSAEWLSLQASISLSDEALDEVARQALRDLALFPPKPNTFSEDAALQVAAMPIGVLDTLVDYGLVEHVGHGRYTLHQAIADYAHCIPIGANMPNQEQAASTVARRFVNYFNQLMAERPADANLLDRERQNVLNALRLAWEHQLWEEFNQGANVLYTFLMDRGLYLEMAEYVSKALALLPKTRHAERFKILTAREYSYYVLGRHEAQLQDLDALEEIAETLDDNQCRAEVALRRAIYAEAVNNYTALLVDAQKAIVLAQSIPDLTIQVRGYLLLGVMQQRSGNYADAKIYLDRALSLCRELGDRRRESAVLSHLGRVSGDQNDFAAAQVYFEQSLRIASEVGYLPGQGAVLAELGGVLQDQGYYTRAQRYLKQALNVFHETGAQWYEGMVLNCLGAIARNQGDFSQAQAYLEHSLYLSRRIDQRMVECGTLIDLGLLFHQLGDDESARKYSQQGLSIAQEIGARKNQGYGLLSLAHALAGLGRWTEAASTYQQATELWQELNQQGLAMEALAGLAYITLAQNDVGVALSYIEKIWEYLEHNSLGALGDPGWVYLICYRVFQAKHDPRAQNVLQAAYNLLQTNAAKIENEDMRHSFLENVPSHRELMAIWRSA